MVLLMKQINLLLGFQRTKTVANGMGLSTGHVHRIHLPGLDGHCDWRDYANRKEYEKASKQKLKGNITSSLLGLQQLKYLDLSCNDFGGIEVPKSIGSLKILRYLNLSNSYFGGNIPSQVGNLTKLHVLCLGNFRNTFDESTTMMNIRWLSSLGMLHHLDKSGVDLSKVVDWLQVINTLPSLVELHMSSCQLSNIHLHVPSLNLTSLSLLDLSLNSFDSSMPKWIFSITSMVSLDLSGCLFNGIIHGSEYSFRNLTSLEFLHVNGNNFINSPLVLKDMSRINLISLDIGVAGHLPNQLGKLSNLVQLRLSENYINGIIPNSIGQLSFLRTLDLSVNQICGSIPYSIGRLSLLEVLDLRLNQLNGSLHDWIGRLSSLNKLYLSHNQLDGPLPDSIGQLSKLVNLDLSFNLLTGVVTETHFANLASLNSLEVKSNNLTLRLQVAKWIPCFHLQRFSVSSLVLGPHFPLWLQSQKDLTYLDISNTKISSTMPDSFMRFFPNLYYLNMSRNHIQGTFTLLGVPSVQIIDLSFNEFRGKLPSFAFGMFPILLDLSSNSFVGSLDNLLCSNGVSEARVLDLGNNNLSGVIPECWDAWPSLILDLAHNNLFGNIPRCFNNFSVLSVMETNSIIKYSFYAIYDDWSSFASESLVTKGREDTYGTILGLVMLLDLSSNNFSGHIPNELMALKKLKFFNLSRNQLTGWIPEKIGDMKTLESLDLSQNKLSGELPMSLAKLNSLSSFNVSYNNLIGKIPTSTQIQSLNESSFFGNKLCGAPLTKTDGCVQVEERANTRQDQKEDDDEDWGFTISILLGFVTGFWIILAPLIVSNSWRIANFRLFIKVRYVVSYVICIGIV
ncbi:receptor-like protein EIX2 [Bidens hawaiensis]|uniref:receptor-like protein EIX2 n=1 Tax=Bidens hawaiensis TaxID=980011 RepID=UPI00404B950A